LYYISHTVPYNKEFFSSTLFAQDDKVTMYRKTGKIIVTCLICRLSGMMLAVRGSN